MTISAARPGSRPVVETRPMRHPDLSDERQMGRRGWWLVVMNMLVPGSAQILAGNRRLGRFGLGATLTGWILLLVAAGLALFARSALVWLFTGPVSWILLTLLQVLLIGYAVLWLVLTIDAIRLVRLVKVPVVSRFALPIAALVVLSLLGGAAVYGSTVAAASRGTLTTIFGNSGPSLPPATGTTTSCCSEPTVATGETPCALTASRWCR